MFAAISLKRSSLGQQKIASLERRANFRPHTNFRRFNCPHTTTTEHQSTPPQWTPFGVGPDIPSTPAQHYSVSAAQHYTTTKSTHDRAHFNNPTRSLTYIFPSEIIYPRNIPAGARTQVPRPSEYGLDDHEELSIPTPDGETLSAFLLRPSNKAQARPVTILLFHGNAGNIGHRLPIGRVLANDINCTVLMLEYRGYGLSTGTPNEQGLVIDAQTGLDYIRSRDDLKNNKIVVFGQSIGGAVAIDLVSKNQEAGDIKGLVLENTFLSIAKMIPSAIPVAKWLTPFCHEYWRSEVMMPKITAVPVLFLSGLQDEIVP